VSLAVFVTKSDKFEAQDLGSKRLESLDVFALRDRIPEIDVHGAGSCLL
jgi:hypothetical protein